MAIDPEVIVPQHVQQPQPGAYPEHVQSQRLPARPPTPQMSRGLRRRVAQSGGHAMVRSADVAAEGRVSVQKTREVQNVVQAVMLSHALNVNMAQTLAQGDPFLADDLNGIAAVGRMAMIQVAADFTDSVRGI